MSSADKTYMLQAIKQLSASGVANSSIGVICFFRAQVSISGLLVAWPGSKYISQNMIHMRVLWSHSLQRCASMLI